MLSAEIILVSKRLHEVFMRYAEFESVKEKIRVINKIDETMEFLRSYQDAQNESQHLVLLASGDPLFFGIGRKVLEEFGHDNVEVFPDLSSIQLAFAAIGEPWDNAFLMSLHGGPDPEKRRKLPYELKDLPILLKKHNKIAILTDKENNPSVIAQSLLPDQTITLYACERLGYPDENIRSGKPEEIAGMSFSDPNVVILVRETSLLSFSLAGNPSDLTICPQKDCGQAAMTDNFGFGLQEDDIVHSRGLITKDEVRAVSIHKLRLPQKGVFWDIGAGSGSISIEAARLYPELRIYSIEKNSDQLGNIKENVARFELSNVRIISGEAPDTMKDLPGPDRVFIGGSSGRMNEIVGLINRCMPKGVIVINVTTLESLSEAMTALADNGFDLNVSEILISRSKKVGSKQHMSALNPVFIIKGEKK